MPGVLRSGAALGQCGALRLSRRGLDALLAVTIAPRCAACEQILDAPLSGPVCGQCWGRVRMVVAPLCRTCGGSLPSWRVISVTLERCARCRRAPALIDASRAAGYYEGSLRAILHAFKYEGRRGLARPLAAMMCTAGADVLEGVDCVVPVPLHPWRLARRGFNQADELARRLGVPMLRALWRTRATAPQSALDASARRRNVRTAFTRSLLLTRRTRRRWLEGRTVVLVDDVRTTGATLDACAGVLRAMGVREVRALTVARADLRPLPATRSEPKQPCDLHDDAAGT